MSSNVPYKTVSKSYDSCVPNQRPAFKRAISTMGELEVDYCDSLAKVMEVIGSPQFESAARNNPQLKTNVDAWQNELISSTANFRERVALLLQDLKYITGPLATDPSLKSRLDQACDSMNPASSTDLASRYPPQRFDDMVADQLNVVYPGYQRPNLVAPSPTIQQSTILNQQPATVIPAQPRSATPPVTPNRNAVNDRQSIVRDPSPSYRIDQNGNRVFKDPSDILKSPPRLARNSTTPPKVYIIDPVTGERIEKRDMSPSPARSTVNNAQQQVD